MVYRMPYDTMRRRYLNAMKGMQASLKIITDLKIRNEVLEAENKALHQRLDKEYPSPALTQIKGAQNV